MDVKDGDKEEKKPVVVKDATDIQRLRLEKLMKNPVCIHFILNDRASLHFHLFSQRSENGQSMSTLITFPGKSLMRNHNRTSK